MKSLETNNHSGNPHMKIRLLNYDQAVKVQNFLVGLGGHSYVTAGALVVEGKASHLLRTIDFIKTVTTGFEMVDMYEAWLGNTEEVTEQLKEHLRNEKLDNLDIE